MKNPDITPLEPPESHHLSAAEGWFELGNCAEAKAELNRLSESGAAHPDALQLLWAIHAHLEEWEQARDVADELVERAPQLPAGWIHRAYATRRMPGGDIEAAWLSLYPAAKLFPDEPVIPYNLACYECQLGRLPEALAWLKRALQIPATPAERKAIQKMALADKDLEKLWPRIRMDLDAT